MSTKNKGATKAAPASVVYDDGTVSANLVARKATIADGVRRGKFFEIAKNLPEETEAEQIKKVIGAFAYPQCVTCVTGVIVIEGMEYNAEQISLDLFSTLPEELITFWLSAVNEVNPALRIDLPVDEKKI